MSANQPNGSTNQPNAGVNQPNASFNASQRNKVCVGYARVDFPLFIVPYCDTAPVVSSLMQVISRPVHTGGGGGGRTAIKRVIRQQEPTPAPSYGKQQRLAK